jgi:hypothetical protein
MAATRKPPATTPIRVWSEDGSRVVAEGVVPVGMLRGTPDRAALLKALSAPKRQAMSKDDAMGALLQASQRKRRGDSLQQLQDRVDAIEAKLGMGRHQKRQAGYLPAEVMPPPPPAA